MAKNKFKAVAAVISTLLVFAVLVSAFTAGADSRRNFESVFTAAGYTHADKYAGYDKAFVVDVSSYNETIDWQKVYDAGIDYAYIRCGYRGYASSLLNEDKYFETNYKNAKAAGLKVGVYFYSQATTLSDSTTEASFVLELLKNRQLDLPVAMDVEYAEENGKKIGRLYEAHLLSFAQTEIINNFCRKIEAAGYKAILYCNTDMMTNHVSELLLNYPLWLAEYSKTPKYSGSYTMWQFSNKLKLDGIPFLSDVSVYYTAKPSTGESTTAAPATTQPSGTPANPVTPTQAPATTQLAEQTTSMFDMESIFTLFMQIISYAMTLFKDVFAALAILFK